jgi:hypothetical protein
MNHSHQPRRKAAFPRLGLLEAPRRVHGLRLGSGCLLALCVVGGGLCVAQDAPDTAIIDTIRTQAQISESDQRRIGDWVEAQVNRLKATPDAQRAPAAVKMRELFKTQFENSANSPAFKEQFASKTASVAASQLGGDLEPISARALSKILVDFNRPETSAAFLTGLKSKDSAVRMLAAAGLAAQRAAIAADKTRLDQTVAALREAGVAETEGVVLDRIYWALSVPPAQVASVFDTFMAIFEKRLERKRAGAVASDGAEITAYEFFRTSGVVTALSPPQKEQLVKALATFLRFDAQRYATPNLNFLEIDRLQRLLDGAEELLVALAPAVKGGDIRGSLAAGHTPDQVLQQANLWVGDAKSNQAGALNAAPWNVPIGAP